MIPKAKAADVGGDHLTRPIRRGVAHPVVGSKQESVTLLHFIVLCASCSMPSTASGRPSSRAGMSESGSWGGSKPVSDSKAMNRGQRSVWKAVPRA